MGTSPPTFNVITANVRGLKKENKQSTIITYIKSKQVKVICLQETYLQSNELNRIRSLWRGEIHCSPGTNHQSGLLTLIDNDFSDIQELYRDARILISKAYTEETDYVIINAYGPSHKEIEKQTFLQHLDKLLQKYSNPNSVCILAGDFNTVMDNNKDIIAGKPHDQNTVNLFNNVIKSNDLIDAWRVCNPYKKEYSWKRNNPLTARRLDYIFTIGHHVHHLSESEILTLPRSDHRAVLAKFEISEFPRGPSYYKFNNNLLTDINFVTEMRSLIAKTALELTEQKVNPNENWEAIKVAMREKSIDYSKTKSGIKKSLKRETERRLNNLESKLAVHPHDPIIQQKIIKETTNLETILEVERRGAAVRANVKWIEEGEQNTAYFLGLEKIRKKKNTISKLTTETGPIEKVNEVQKELHRYYSSLYALDTVNNKKEMLDFHLNIDIPEIKEKDSKACEENLTLLEIGEALKNMNNNSAPGLDGLTTEFYKVFWQDIRIHLLNSYLHSTRVKKLAPTQLMGVTTLIHKGKNLKKNDLNNWRPITVTNVDYKILAKAVANRLKPILTYIISDSQHGFIKSRGASQLIRQIDDIIQVAEEESVSGHLLSVDYKKCFDSVSHKYILFAVKQFGFRENFSSLIEILMRGGKSCINNGGWLTEFYELNKGLKQGCPCSPLTFLLVAEILTLKTKQNKNIKGFFIEKAHCIRYKILQFADDTTFLLRDIIDFREVLSLIKSFSLCSGLQLNTNKSQLMPLSTVTKPLVGQREITSTNRLVILGVCFETGKAANTLEENWKNIINKIQYHIKNWSRRNLSIQGKIIITKTFIISQCIYMMQGIGLPEKIISQINKMCFTFIWKKHFSNTKAHEKIKRTTMCSPYQCGGLQMINLHDMQASFHIKWIIKLCNSKGSDWAKIPLYLLNHLDQLGLFHMNIPKLNQKKTVHTIKSSFWAQAVTAWFAHKEPEDATTSLYLWNNKDITYHKKTLYFITWIEAGIRFVKDVINENSKVLDYEILKRKTGNHPSFLFEYLALREALNRFKRTRQCPLANLRQNQNVWFKTLDINNMQPTVSQIRKLIILQNTRTPHCLELWKRKYNYTIQEADWTVAHGATKETRLRVLQWKIIHNIYPTSILLQKMGKRETNLCETCKEIDYIEHFFVNCNEVQALWKEVNNIINCWLGIRFPLDEKTILLGLNNSALNKTQEKNINHLLLTAKMCVSKYKYGKRFNLCYTFHKECALRGIKPS